MTLCECGKFAYSRQTIGPRGKQQWTIIVDTCTFCGKHHALHPEYLTATQAKWLERKNSHVGVRIS